MAYTRISDVVVPQVYADQVNAELSTVKDALWNSGAIAVDALLSAELAGGFGQRGNSIMLPAWKPWTAADVVGSDDPSASIATNARTEFDMKATKLYRAFSLDAMDVARYQAAGDPMSDIAAQAAKNVLSNRQTALINTMTGIKADNDANDSDDMITKVQRTTAGTVGAGNRLSRSVVLDGKAQRGDYGDNPVAAIVMHSAVFYQLMKDDASSFERPSDQPEVTNYLGTPVIVDDRMPTGTQSSETVYTTAILSAGAFRLGSSGVTAVVDRDEKIGNGFGGESLITRRIDILHPEGFDFTGTDNGANGNLALATSWDRQYARKNVGISFIESNV